MNLNYYDIIDEHILYNSDEFNSLHELDSIECSVWSIRSAVVSIFELACGYKPDDNDVKLLESYVCAKTNRITLDKMNSDSLDFFSIGKRQLLECFDYAYILGMEV